MKDIRLSAQFFHTQQSLSTFGNCPLKFRKRYMEGLKWDNPDLESKAAVERGSSFHLLARRYFLGIDIGLNENSNDYAILKKLTDNLKRFFELRPDTIYLPEYTLRTGMEGFRLEANFDLVVVRNSKIEIWDWKTQNSNQGEGIKNIGRKFEKSLQTSVYLYTLMEQAAVITGEPQDYEDISMHYWQPDPPCVIAEICYNKQMHERFGILLHKKIKDIENIDWHLFDKSLYAKHCRFCEFNWYCNSTF
jgi:hypothetical protein